MILEQLCSEVVALCKEVGAFIRYEGQLFTADKIEHKGLNDLVSYVDKTAEERLVKALQKLLPESGFITEEKTINKLAKDYNWIIDPLDGTTNFIHGLPIYSISIALQYQQETIFGVVYEIGQDECFYAYKGSKAFLNGTEICVSANDTLSKSLVATGFPYSQFVGIDSYLHVLKLFMQQSHGVRRLGSAAVDLAYVACGRFDAFFEYNLNAWDVAAGAFIVQQAGGRVSNFTGGTEFIHTRQIVASNAHLSEEVLNTLKPFTIN